MLHGYKTRKTAQAVAFVKRWLYMPKEPVSPEILEKLREGLVMSDFTPERIISYFQKQES